MENINVTREANVIAAVFLRECGRTSTKRYHYFCPYPVRVGDHVIVDSPYDGYTCVRVVEVLQKGSIKASKPVIQVVDDTDYKTNLERQKRVNEIKTKLKQRQAQIAEMQFYRQLAAMDPEAKQLVDELEQLSE